MQSRPNQGEKNTLYNFLKEEMGYLETEKKIGNKNIDRQRELRVH